MPGSDADSTVPCLSLLAQATAALADDLLPSALQSSAALVTVASQQDAGYLVAQAMVVHAVAAARSGNLAGVAECAARAIDAVDPEQWHETLAETVFQVLGAQGALAAGKPERCLEILDLVDLEDQPRTVTRLGSVRGWIDVLAATAVIDSDDVSAGLDRLAAARNRIIPERSPVDLLATIAMVEHDAALQAGRTEHAREVLAWARQVLPGTGELHCLGAQRAIRISRFRYARTELAPVLDGTLVPRTPATLIEAWLAETWIRIRLGERTRAIAGLTRAMELAQRQATIRPLLRAPLEVVNLISDRVGAWGNQETVAHQVLAGRRQRPTATVPLTRRELQVLSLLPGMRSLEEISGDLSVSLNTVKTHVRAIYSKLGATSRRQAVLAARREGLL